MTPRPVCTSGLARGMKDLDVKWLGDCALNVSHITTIELVGPGGGRWVLMVI